MAAAIGAAASRGPLRDAGLSARRCNRVLEVDPAAGRVRVEAGVTLGALQRRLAAWGQALQSPAAAGHTTLADAIGSGTHGSGLNAGSLAAQVLDLDVVAASGDIVRCSAREVPDLFAAARCGLGALGVIVRATLRTVPAFNVAVDELTCRLDGIDLAAEIAGSEYFSCAWHPHRRLVVLRRARRSAAPPGGLGLLATLAAYGGQRAALAARCRAGRRWPALVAATAGIGIAGRQRHYSDRSYRALCGLRPGRAAQCEWALPLPALGDALWRLADWHGQSWGRRHIPAAAFPVEVATGPADDIWLSPAYQRATGYLAIRAGLSEDPAAAGEWFAAAADILGALGGRPRLGSLAAAGGGTGGLAGDPGWGEPLGWAGGAGGRSGWDGQSGWAGTYPRWHEWQALRRRVDPAGVFASPRVARLAGLGG